MCCVLVKGKVILHHTHLSGGLVDVISSKSFFFLPEQSGKVVECLARDGRAKGSSLTALCP